MSIYAMLDASGLFHHVKIIGIECKTIFEEERSKIKILLVAGLPEARWI